MENIDKEMRMFNELASDGSILKTKIVCTLGLRDLSVLMIEKLLRAGMNVARFNFFNGTQAFHSEILMRLRQAMRNTGILCAVMLDIQGPGIRTGSFFKNGRTELQVKEGQEMSITTNMYNFCCRRKRPNEEMFYIGYKKLADDLKPGNRIVWSRAYPKMDPKIAYDDSAVTLAVLSCDPAAETVRCRCENTGMLSEFDHVNLPGVVLDLPTLTDKDKKNILEWGVPNNVDMIAISLVRKGSDLVTVRRLLGSHAKHIKLMAKIENHEGVTNFDEILGESDAVMIVRRRLGMEIGAEKLVLAQKMMIYKCNLAGKPVVTATWMLDSMEKSPCPTGAEPAQVANAILDGADCVMLDGETAYGCHPDVCVKTMAQICVDVESSLSYIYGTIFVRAPPDLPLESLASSAASTAKEEHAKLIVVLSHTTAAKLVAKYRPTVPILSVSVLTTAGDTTDGFDAAAARESLFYRGLIPILIQPQQAANNVAADTSNLGGESTELILLESALKQALHHGLCQSGDPVVALYRIGAASVIKIYHVK